MTFRHEIANNATEAFAAAQALFDACSSCEKMPVLLVSSPAHASRVRRLFSQSGRPFGADVQALPAWIADRWELFGDGRRIVSPAERTVLVHQSISEVARRQKTLDSSVLLDATPGTVALVSSLACEALPYLLDDCSNVQNTSLSLGEQAIIASLTYYAQLLAERNQCEESQAACELAGVLLESCLPTMIMLGFDQLTYAFQRLLEAFSQKTDVIRIDDGCLSPSMSDTRASELNALLGRLFHPSSLGALVPTGAVRFLLPSGRYALPALVAREAAQAVMSERRRVNTCDEEELPIFVVCRDPASAFSGMADYLGRLGVVSALSTRVTFAQTAFGRVFLGLANFAFSEKYQVAEVSDFALSSFSGISRHNAWTLDAAWRSDRTVDRERIGFDLSAASEVAADVLAAFARSDLDKALESLEKRFRKRLDIDAGYRAEQLASMRAARRFVEACRLVGVAGASVLPFLEQVSVSVGLQIDAFSLTTDNDTAFDSPIAQKPDVWFMGLADAADYPACSCATLVLCDLEASSYPVRAEEDGGTLLMEKLGFAQPADALVMARRRFFRVLSTARGAVVCERVLNTVDGSEAYPAVMFDELLDCYRDDPTQSDDLNRVTGLPCALAPYAQVAGEDNLHGNLTFECDISTAHRWDLPKSGEVSAAGQARVLLPRDGCMDRKHELALALSPSAIESYLECPYKWFASRRLRLSEPDAGFGPLEMGSFSHGVLKSFYEHFAASGHVKVHPSNIAQAEELMREVFARHIAFQPELKRNRNPLVARTEFEKIELRNLERRLVCYLERESKLLSDFIPTHFEFDFGSTEPFVYAGCELRGSVDRIDVNERGQAVVIDYKGSVSKDYVLASASAAAQADNYVLPHKVQALIYAQVARRLLGYEVVGALYVPYGRKGCLVGAIDRAVLSEESLPGIDVEACGAPGKATEALGVDSFSEVVDYVEEGIAKSALSMNAGLIAPDPRGENPCKYCPVFACEKRRSS